MATDTEKLLLRVEAQTKAARGEIDKLTKKIANDNRAMAASFKKPTQAMRGLEAQAAKTAGVIKRQMAGAIAAVAGLAAIGIAGKQFLDFETSMQRIVGLVGVAQHEVDGFSAAVLKMAGVVGKSPTELADALFYVTSAGIKGAAAMQVLDRSARAAVAGLGETKQVADAVTSAMNAYASQGLTAAQATDVLVATVREGKLAADTLSASIGAVLPLAQAAGVRFDEVGASIAALTRVGLPAAEAVAGLRGILAALAKENQRGAKVLKAVGLSYAQLRDIVRKQGLLAAMQKLYTALHGNEAALVHVTGRIEAANAVMALVGGNAKQVAGIFERLRSSTGALDKAYAAVAETAQQRLNRALAQLSVIGIELARSVVPPLVGALQGLVDAIQFLGRNIDIVIAAAAGLATVAFGPALLAAMTAAASSIVSVSGALIGLSGALGVTTTAILALKTAASAAWAVIAANPFGVLAVAIAGAVYGYQALTDWLTKTTALQNEVNKAQTEGKTVLDQLNKATKDSAAFIARVADAKKIEIQARAAALRAQAENIRSLMTENKMIAQMLALFSKFGGIFGGPAGSAIKLLADTTGKAAANAQAAAKRLDAIAKGISTGIGAMRQKTSAPAAAPFAPPTATPGTTGAGAKTRPADQIARRLAEQIAKLREQRTELGLTGAALEEYQRTQAAAAIVAGSLKKVTAEQREALAGVRTATALVNFVKTQKLGLSQKEIATITALIAKYDAEAAANARVKAATEAAARAKQQLLSMAQRVGQGLEDALVGALDRTGSAMENLQNIARNMVQEILRQFLRLAVINPLLNSLFGLGGTKSALPSIFDFGKLFKAGGGPVTAGQPYIVGEKRPELFVPSTNGRIEPRVPAGRGGPTMIVYGDFTGASRAEFERFKAWVVARDGQVEERSVRAVSNAQRRGGAFARQFA